MIGELGSYSKMIDSGLTWLGEVPEHWEVKRLGWIADLIVPMRDKPEIFDGDVPWIRIEDFNGKYISDSKSEQRVSTDTVKRMNLKVYPAGTVLCSCSCNMGCSAIVTRPLISNQTFIGIVPKARASSNYLYYLLISCGSHLQSMSSGAIQQYLSRYDFSHLSIPLPPLPEQSAIVRFLEHADPIIRRAVGARRRLIALLDEEKQAVIHRAVTRGLEHDVPLRSSGVEWLGDVPAHWEVRRIGQIARVGNGSTPSRGNAAYWTDGTFPWLNSATVNHSPIVSSDQFVTDIALCECHLPRVPAGSVLIAITGQGKTRGTSAILEFEATINQHIAFITPRLPTISSKYLQLVLTGAYRELRRISDDTGSTKGALTCEDVKMFKVPVPPLDEQDVLVSLTCQETQNIEGLISTIRREIDLLLEFRTRLIADVVTGKLDVRGVAVGLPETTPGQATLDAFDAPAGDEEDAWPEPGAALEDGDGIGA